MAERSRKEKQKGEAENGAGTKSKRYKDKVIWGHQGEQHQKQIIISKLFQKMICLDSEKCQRLKIMWIGKESTRAAYAAITMLLGLIREQKTEMKVLYFEDGNQREKFLQDQGIGMSQRQAHHRDITCSNKTNITLL